jgi:hypothetical protein
MFEIAGLIVSVIGVLNDLGRSLADLAKWQEMDITVDDEWLGEAIKQGVLTHQAADYAWVGESRVATRELKGTANTSSL